MTLAEVVLSVMFVGLIAYALFGGADFGAGTWDLLAGGTKRGQRQRDLIEHSIGPVWEANHVWLIFVLVVLWTAFSGAFVAVTTTLYAPLTLAAFGMIAHSAVSGCWTMAMPPAVWMRARPAAPSALAPVSTTPATAPP